MISIIPAPYRSGALIIAVMLIVVAIFGLGWSRGSDRVQAKWDKAKAVQVQVALEAEKTARQREQSMIDQIRKAENDANDREEKRRAAVAAVADTDGRLQLALNTIRHSLPGNTADACRATADTALAVFGDCAAALGKLAGEADGIASDRQTLIEAWPK